MALYSVTAGNTALAADVNQYKSVLEGSATSTWLVKAASTTHFQVQLADNAGSYTFKILDSDGVAVATIDSNGNLTLSGSFAPSTLVLPIAASPSQTAEGSVVWDSDDDLLTVGDGTSRKTFYPGTMQYKYKTSSQNFTTTTLTDVTATSGNLALTLPANTTQLVDLWVHYSAVGTAASGGYKCGLTFTNSPTTARILSGTYPGTTTLITDGAINVKGLYDIEISAAAVTTGSTFLGSNSDSGTGGGLSGVRTGWLRVRFLFVVAGTASVVTFQSAQNTAAGTTTLASAVMTATTMIAG